MAPQKPNELLDWLVNNQFLSESRVAALRCPPASYPDAIALAKELLQRNWLTPYQVNQIFQGFGDSLVLGPYRLLERLGEGAMGQVYKAWNPKLESLAAIKMIHKEHLASRKAEDRFNRELETVGRLDHKNIVLVRDAGVINNRKYMVMDFIDGVDLARIVKERGPLPCWQAADYIRQAAEGLQHAFERGVFHRDIKPGNLLLGRDGVVKIMDFGLARLDSADLDNKRLTVFGSVLGTVDYIAPEQAENAQAADHRSDVYSLGCTLYYLLAGRPPFAGSTMVERVSARMIAGPPSIRKLRPDVPDGLDAIIQKMMARAAADRYQSAGEVADALASFCERPKDVPLATPVERAPLAQPVLRTASPALGPGGVPLAQPVSQANQAYDPFAFGHSEDQAPPNSEVSASTATRPASPPPVPPAYWLAGGGALLLLALVIFFMVRGCDSGGAKKGYPANANVYISLKQASMEFKPGDRKSLIFQIRRSNFEGPVEVSLKDVPEGIQGDGVLLSKEKQDGYIPITVPFLTPPGQYEINVVAVAENLRGQTILRLKVLEPPKD